MAIFTSKDVFEFAVKIEEKGEDFYTRMEQKFDDSDLQKLFAGLAQAERNHKRTFLGMAEQLGEFQESPLQKEDFLAYMEAYTQNLIYNDSLTDARIAAIEDVDSALVYAINKELESVFYYQEIKNLVPVSEHNMIDGIIGEERGHVVQLAEMKKKFDR